jgi:hypothetical protein
MGAMDGGARRCQLRRGLGCVEANEDLVVTDIATFDDREFGYPTGQLCRDIDPFDLYSPVGARQPSRHTKRPFLQPVGITGRAAGKEHRKSKKEEQTPHV